MTSATCSSTWTAPSDHSFYKQTAALLIKHTIQLVIIPSVDLEVLEDFQLLGEVRFL